MMDRDELRALQLERLRVTRARTRASRSIVLPWTTPGSLRAISSHSTTSARRCSCDPRWSLSSRARWNAPRARRSGWSTTARSRS